MMPNQECMKDVLQYVADHVKVKFESNQNISIHSTSIPSAVKALSDKYSAEEIAYNILKCNKYHLIDSNIPVHQKLIRTDQMDIYDITLAGEDFILCQNSSAEVNNHE